MKIGYVIGETVTVLELKDLNLLIILIFMFYKSLYKLYRQF